MASPDETVRVATFTLDDDVVQGAGVVQGGVLAGVLSEAVTGFAASLVGDGRVVELETLDVFFERPALPGSYDVHATATRSGRTLVAWDARLVDSNGRIVARARTTHRVRAT